MIFSCVWLRKKGECPMETSWIVIAVVIAYMAIMLFVGWYSKNMISDNKDFMVAGRRLGPILMAGTLAATEIGGGSSLGVVTRNGKIWYQRGLVCYYHGICLCYFNLFSS